MEPETAGWIGGVGGTVLGVLGGAVGTYFSIRNTRGPRERAFMIRASVACWAAVAAFLVVLWLIPSPYRFLLWIPYGSGLAWAVRAGNRVQEQIRREEAASEFQSSSS